VLVVDPTCQQLTRFNKLGIKPILSRLLRGWKTWK